MYLILLVLLVFFLFMVLHAGHLKTEHLAYGDGTIGLRVALISDLHMGLLMVSQDDVKKALLSEKPDLLIIAGDIIDRENHVSEFVQWIKKVAPNLPIFATLGNHDHKCFEKFPRAKELFFFNLKSLGIELLVNQCMSFHKNGRVLNLVGVDDYRRGNPQPKTALAAKDPHADLTLAIAHNPETVLMFPEGSVDLLMCGHFHGGQIWMPFSMEYRFFRKEQTCKAGYRRGLHTINGINTYISRGIGNVVFPFRLGSRPEITFIDL
ncbi:MAG: metallophosphoesterase [Clostridia bacterium]|nr:metallophosphoesterase [Clostridia bacterium]